MSGQPSVLQVVILRDGLLVGTEVFVPGQYTLGSASGVDLKLDDPSVGATHAHLFFQNGRAAIQDAGAGAVFVNGHRVTACELRPVDEVNCGPFTLKVRVLAQRSAAKAAPSAEMSALLADTPEGATQLVPQFSPDAAGQMTPPSSRRVPAPPGPKGNPTGPTVVSPRRMNAVPAPAPVNRGAPHLRPVEMPLDDLTAENSSPGGPDSELTVPVAQRNAVLGVAPALAQPPPPARAAPPKPAPPVKAAAKRSARRERATSAIPGAADGRGKPHLFVELYWGEVRKHARSFSRIDPKHKLVATEDDAGHLPLWGFHLKNRPFTFAEQKGGLFRVFVPPGAAVERRAQDGNFYPVGQETLELASNQQRCVTMGTGHAVRFTGDGQMTCVAYVQPAIPRPFSNPLKGLPWLVLVFLALFSSAFAAFLSYYGDRLENADFQAKDVRAAVHLVAPPKKEEQKKIEEKIEHLKKKEEKKKPEPKVAKKEEPKPVPQETKKALKSVEKLVAAGPAMKDLLAAVDKLGSGPGAKNAKNDFKLSGLIGKAPVANAGLGSFGLGGGGGGGMGIKGAELLRGKGATGIGALGAGNIGKGSVAGTVTHAVARAVGAQGSIDKEAVAKVINSHLNEVSSCYERALLKEAGLAGKIILEWQITVSGSVGYAKTKSSTMKSSAVEQCILGVLKLWKFPAAKGAGVVITYPFMFNSIGY